MTDFVVVCETLEIASEAALPHAFAAAWMALSARMLGAPNAMAPWSALVGASRRLDAELGLFEWSAPLPYPVRLSAAELACGRLSVAPLPADTTLMLSAYTGTLTLALSSGVWEPAFCEGEDGRPRVALSSPKGSRVPTSVRLGLEFLTRVPYHQPQTPAAFAPVVAVRAYWRALLADALAAFST